MTLFNVDFECISWPESLKIKFYILFCFYPYLPTPTRFGNHHFVLCLCRVLFKTHLKFRNVPFFSLLLLWILFFCLNAPLSQPSALHLDWPNSANLFDAMTLHFLLILSIFPTYSVICLSQRRYLNSLS